jgi:hypothetical protein
MGVRIVGFFCEDIRQETAGSESIIGVLPDNMTVPLGAIPKLAVYIRIYIDLDEMPQTVFLSLRLPWGDPIQIGEAPDTIFEEARTGARANNLPAAGITMRAILSPFPVAAYGLLTAVATVAGTEHICAMMNIKPPAAQPAPTISEQPDSQSPSAS